MTDGKESREAGRFAVSTIVVSNDPQKKEIVEYLEKIEDELSASSAENWSAEGDSQDYMEEWNADNIDRINPVYVEGAEDVHGAEEIYEAQGIGPILGNVIPEPHFVNNEELMEESRKNRDAKDSESFDIQSAFIHGAEGTESWAVEVHDSEGGVFLAELDTGLILHNNSSFSAEDDTPLSAEEMNAILSIAAESEATPVRTYLTAYALSVRIQTVPIYRFDRIRP